jgi:cytochrome c biogenesis protein CcmG/thiol:disulfide interchange protein DsbE
VRFLRCLAVWGLALLVFNGSAPASYDGRPILLDFGSAFCKNCQKTAEWMGEVHRKLGKAGLGVAMISIGGFGSRKAVAAVLAGLNASYPLYFDEGFATAGRYGVSMIPCRFLIDRKGIVRSIHIGFEKDLFDEGMLKGLLQ